MKPKAFSANQKAKYSVVLALPSDDDFWKSLEKKMKALAKEKWPDTPYKKIKTFIKEYEEGDDECKYGWEDHKVITLSNKSRPGVVIRSEDGFVEPMSEDEIYSGMFCRATFNVGCYEYNKSKGITFYLNNVLKVKDGERFTTRATAEEDFADFVDDEWE
jgi:hypothetical protein